MIVTLLVCGKIKPGPMRVLVEEYLVRAKQLGRNLGVSDVRLQQVALAPNKNTAQTGQLALCAAQSAQIKIVLDETGRNLSTEKFAKQINIWREQGLREICLMVGPADGWGGEVRKQADLVLSFGQMTWPHKLVHVMAAEQIYRVLSIIGGSPYHRGAAE